MTPIDPKQQALLTDGCASIWGNRFVRLTVSNTERSNTLAVLLSLVNSGDSLPLSANAISNAHPRGWLYQANSLQQTSSSGYACYQWEVEVIQHNPATPFIPSPRTWSRLMYQFSVCVLVAALAALVFQFMYAPDVPVMTWQRWHETFWFNSTLWGYGVSP